MHPSILCPTTPPTGLGGARWGFLILASTKAPPLGVTLADKSSADISQFAAIDLIKETVPLRFRYTLCYCKLAV